MIHEAIMILSVSCMILRPAVGWLKEKIITDKTKLALRRKAAATAFRSCRKWLAAWVILHVVIVLALVRGISSGGGIFAPELDKWQLVLVKKLPARALTRIWGRIALIYIAPLARRPLLGLFCALFGIKLDDAKRQELKQFSSLHDFFTRTLKEEARPICPDHSVVSPADGMVVHVGKIVDGEVKQVKGVNYKVTEFFGKAPLQDLASDGPVLDEESYENYESGLPRNDSVTNLLQNFPYLKPSRGNDLYHAVVYLHVSDYHHFHSPADWNIQMRRHIVGDLLSVAPWVVRQIPNLFSLNERIFLGGYWEHGFFSLTAVGAYNVGSIDIDIDEQVTTNSSKDENESGVAYQGESCDRLFGFEGVASRKGDHLGLFHLGSTIVLVFEAPKSFEFSVSAGDRIKFGQALGTATRKMHSMDCYDE